MKKPVPPKSQLVSKLSNIRAGDVAALSRLSSAETTSAEFGRVFRENPAAALAAKGIVIDDVEAGKIAQKIGQFSTPGNLAKTEVEVSVKIKF